MNCSQMSGEKVAPNASADERLVSLARNKISTSRLRAWSKHLQIHCSDGHMSLSGHLPSFYFKQVLQTIVGNLPGVQRVDNAVEVRPASEEPNQPRDPYGPSS